MVLVTGLMCERWEIWFGFGGSYFLFPVHLLHVTFLHFIGFEKVFCHIGPCESRKCGDIAIADC